MATLKSKETFEQLRSTLRAWGRRKWWLDYLNWLPRIVVVALIPALIVAIVSRFKPLATNNEIGLLGLALISIAVTFTTIILIWQRPSLMDQARFADKQFRLQERMVTAVELQEGQISTAGDLQDLQLEESLAAAGKVNSREEMPVRINWRDWLLVISLLLLWGASIFMENSQAKELQNKRLLHKQIEEQTTQLESLATDVNNNTNLSAAQKEQLVAPIERAINQLADGDLSQEEAVAELSQAEQELRELSESTNNIAGQEALQRAGESLSEVGAAQELGENLSSGDPLEAAAAVRELAEQLSSLNEADQASLREGFSEAASTLEATNAALANALQRSAQALATGDEQVAAEALQEMAETLQATAEDQTIADQATALADEIEAGRQAIALVGEQETDAGGATNAEKAIEGDEGTESESGAPGEDSGSSSSIESLIGPPDEADSAVEETIYFPPATDLAGFDGMDLELPNTCTGDPQVCGILINETPADFMNEGSLIPYQQVFPAYQEAANEAIANDVIPLGLRDTVHDYFSSLER